MNIKASTAIRSQALKERAKSEENLSDKRINHNTTRQKMQKVKLTPTQKKALNHYNFCLQQEDRYLGSVFVTPSGQERGENRTRDAHEACKALGMDWTHGL